VNNIHACNQASLDLVVACCQLLAGRVAEGAPITGDDMCRLAGVLPPRATVSDRLVIRSVLATLFSRMARSDVNARPEVAAAFLEWTSSSPTSEAWIADIADFIESWADKGSAGGSTMRFEDARVHRALRLIDVRYHDATLSLHDVAADMNLSRCHTARLMKHRTGCGFATHLRRRRILEAQRLLRHTSLSVKEIAAAVGYADSTLGRHFKRACGQSPATFAARRNNRR
jgi:AraC-like DNA-binding protein